VESGSASDGSLSTEEEPDKDKVPMASGSTGHSTEEELVSVATDGLSLMARELDRDKLEDNGSNGPLLLDHNTEFVPSTERPTNRDSSMESGSSGVVANLAPGDGQPLTAEESDRDKLMANGEPSHQEVDASEPAPEPLMEKPSQSAKDSSMASGLSGEVTNLVAGNSDLLMVRESEEELSTASGQDGLDQESEPEPSLSRVNKSDKDSSEESGSHSDALLEEVAMSSEEESLEEPEVLSEEDQSSNVHSLTERSVCHATDVESALDGASNKELSESKSSKEDQLSEEEPLQVAELSRLSSDVDQL